VNVMCIVIPAAVSLSLLCSLVAITETQ
jgi:hypothetical protein